jgi:hypothetical protein
MSAQWQLRAFFLSRNTSLSCYLMLFLKCWPFYGAVSRT